MNSEMESTAIREAISPAAWPPMPSATRNRRASLSTRYESSLCCRCLPTCVSPNAFTSIPSPLLKKGEPFPCLGAPLAQVGEGALDLAVLRIPLRCLFEISLRFGAKSSPFAEKSGIFQKCCVVRLALHGGFDRLDRLPRVSRDPRRGERQIMPCFCVLGVVLHRHVEVFVGGTDVSLFVGLDSLGQVGLGHLGEIGRGRLASGADLGVVLFAAGGGGEGVYGLGERLEAAIGDGRVGCLVAVGVIFGGEVSEMVPDLVL